MWTSLTACTSDDAKPDDEASGQADDGGDDDGDDDGGGETGEPPPLGDSCRDTLLQIEAPTTTVVTLRGASPDPDGVGQSCGLVGPSVFAELRLSGRADLIVSARGRGFVPRLAISPPGCVDEPDRTLACGGELPVTLADLGPDLELLLAVAIDPDDPALAAEFEPAQGDPLEVELRLEARPVLAELDRCGPAFGRCEAGTVCLAADEDGAPVERCRRPPADSCVAPGSTELSLDGPAVIEIASTDPHSDAHEHSCAGWRRPERVEALSLPAALAETATLVVVADDPRVGLALRGPDCLPEHELACAPAPGSVEPATLSLSGPELAALATAEAAPLLFIELPSPDEPDPPATIQVSVELVQ